MAYVMQGRGGSWWSMSRQGEVGLGTVGVGENMVGRGSQNLDLSVDIRPYGYFILQFLWGFKSILSAHFMKRVGIFMNQEQEVIFPWSLLCSQSYDQD